MIGAITAAATTIVQQGIDDRRGGRELRAANLAFVRDKSSVDDDLARPFNGIDLEGQNLIGLRLQGSEWVGANLAYADLSYADLSSAVLTNTNLSGANLTGANLTDASMTGANLTDADLKGVTLTGAELFSANFSGADLTAADLADVTEPNGTTTRVNMPEGTVLFEGICAERTKWPTFIGSQRIPPDSNPDTCARWEAQPPDQFQLPSFITEK